MKKFLPFLVLFVLSCVPAVAADYLAFPPGEERSTFVWKDEAPVAGQNMPADWTAYVWNIVDGDIDCHNYKLENGVVVHVPIVVEAPTPDPNVPQVEAFKTAVFQDVTIPLNARLKIAILFPLLDRYAVATPANVMQFWGGMKLEKANGNEEEYGWLTPTVIEKVEVHGVTYKIPLVPPQ